MFNNVLHRSKNLVKQTKYKQNTYLTVMFIMLNNKKCAKITMISKFPIRII